MALMVRVHTQDFNILEIRKKKRLILILIIIIAIIRRHDGSKIKRDCSQRGRYWDINYLFIIMHGCGEYYTWLYKIITAV